jgi:hypothetical protein
MNVISYKKLFHVRCFQGYYEAMTGRHLRFIPDIETQRLLKSYSMLFKQTPDGFVILYNVDKQNLILRLAKDLSIRVMVAITEGHFANFTLLEHANQRELYYLTNAGKSSVASEGGKTIKLLHEESFIGARDIRAIVRSNTTVLGSSEESEISLSHKTDTIVSGKVATGATYAQVLGEDWGAYTLAQAGHPDRKIYFHDAISSGVFAMIDLAVGPNAGMDLQASETMEVHLRLPNRPVKWNYVFAGDKLESSSIEVSSETGDVQFSAPEPVVLVNGKRALRFSSENLIPLKDQYIGDKLFATISNTSSVSQDKRIRLPTPDVKRIKGSILSGEQVYFSEMYVYL